MADFILSLIGPPVIRFEPFAPERRISFRYRDTWTLLASLVLDPLDSDRDLLVTRLGLDETDRNGRNKLRLRLDDLRYGSRNAIGPSSSGIGEDRIDASRHRIKLNAGSVSTDIEFIQRSLLEASNTTDIDTIKAILQQCFPLLRGDFLEGVVSDRTDQEWFGRWNHCVRSLTSEVWMLYGNALKNEGKSIEAFDAFRRAYLANPVDSDAIAEILSSPAISADVPLIERPMSLEALVPKLITATDSNKRITVVDHELVLASVADRLRQLSPTTQQCIKNLASIPIPVSLVKASQILNIPHTTIAKAVESISCTVNADYIMIHPVVIEALRQQTDSDAKVKVERQFLNYMLGEWYAMGSPHRFTEQSTDCYAIVACVVNNNHDVDLRYLERLVHNTDCIGITESAENLFRYLDTFSSTHPIHPSAVVGIKVYVLTVCQRYSEVVEIFINYCDHNDHLSVTDWYTPLLACHHGELESSFDIISAMYFDLKARDSYELFQIYQISAENSLSRADYINARKYNDQAMENFKLACPSVPMHGRLLTQHAYISQYEGQTNFDLLKLWDSALAMHQHENNFEAQAECLREMAKIGLELGYIGMATSHIDLAIRLCEKCDKQDAKSVCQGVLAQIKLKTGSTTDGVALLTQVRDYWLCKGHKKWTQYFTNQLPA